MEAGTRIAVARLISHVLGAPDPRCVESLFSVACDFISAPLIPGPRRPIADWERRWRPSLTVGAKSRLEHVSRDFKGALLPIFRVLHDLRHTARGPIPAQKPSNEASRRRSSRAVGEPELVADLLALLQGGAGNRITLTAGTFAVNGCVTSPHGFVVGQVAKAVACLDAIASAATGARGVVGQAVADGLQAERRRFLLTMAPLPADETSLLSLLSLVRGSDYERLTASACVSRIVGSDGASVLNALALCDNHGNPTIVEIGRALLGRGIAVMVEFIRDWVVHGRLDDPHGEFFVARSDGRVDSWDWWGARFTVVSERIPLFLVDEDLIAKIVSGGRAWNFVRKYKSLQSEILSEGEFEGRKFTTDLVSGFSAQAMKNAMKIMMEHVWVPGHLRTLNDFILFFRGDFASALFQTLCGDRRSEALNALLVPLKLCTSGAAYTNRVTGERLMERIDLQMKATTNRTR